MSHTSIPPTPNKALLHHQTLPSTRCSSEKCDSQLLGSPFWLFHKSVAGSCVFFLWKPWTVCLLLSISISDTWTSLWIGLPYTGCCCLQFILTTDIAINQWLQAMQELWRDVLGVIMETHSNKTQLSTESYQGYSVLSETEKNILRCSRNLETSQS